MAFKRFVTVEEFAELPEVVQAEYGEEKDEKHMLSVDDDAENKKKFTTFRNNNKKLHTQNEKLLEDAKRFEGVDPAKYEEGQKALDTVSKLEAADLLKEGKVDEAIENQVSSRVATMKSDYEAKFKVKENEAKSAVEESTKTKQRYRKLKIDSGIQTAANSVGKLRSGAMDDVISRAHSVWHVDDDGKEYAEDSHGDPIYGPDGDPITMKEWMGALLEDAPHLFEGGGGGGASGGSKGAASTGRTIANDPLSLGKNVEKVASGKVEVRER